MNNIRTPASPSNNDNQALGKTIDVHCLNFVLASFIHVYVLGDMLQYKTFCTIECNT